MLEMPWYISFKWADYSVIRFFHPIAREQLAVALFYHACTHKEDLRDEDFDVHLYFRVVAEWIDEPLHSLDLRLTISSAH